MKQCLLPAAIMTITTLACSAAAQPTYDEPLRPQFHFTSARNWLNDPNGLVFYSGEYHMFFQHNPNGIEWGDMTWGHAVSKDLVHWQQLDNAITPDGLGTVYSGSAAVDWRNTSGFGKDGQPPMVAMYTAAGGQSPQSRGQPFTQCIAFSTDKGRTWSKFSGNPVITHIAAENRDPKIIWHEPTRRWIVALYEDGSRFSLHSSPDLKRWTKLHDLEVPGSSECPDFFPMSLDGDASKQRWVFTSADGRYLVGDFDGAAFKPTQAIQRVEFGQNSYAAQTFSDIPSADGRRIQIAWMRGGHYPAMPFNQQMSFPAELTLRSTPDGPRLYRNPVRELESLHTREHRWTDLVLKPGDNPLAELKGDLFDIRADIELVDATEVGFIVRGQTIAYDPKKQQLNALGAAPLPLLGRSLRLQVLMDRTSIETFADEGRASLTSCFLATPSEQALSLFARGGAARIRSLTIFELKPIWR